MIKSDLQLTALQRRPKSVQDFPCNNHDSDLDEWLSIVRGNVVWHEVINEFWKDKKFEKIGKCGFCLWKGIVPELGKVLYIL